MKYFLIFLVLASFIGIVFAEETPQQPEPTPTCPEGTILKNNACIGYEPICGEGTTDQDGVCVVDKLQNISSNSSAKWGTGISFPPALQLDNSKLSLFDNIFSVTEKQVRYDVFYNVTNASINNVQLNCDSSSLTVSILSDYDGTLQLDIPKGMLGGIFMVLVDDKEWDDVSIDGNILTVNFTEVTSTIKILGSYELSTSKNDGVCDVIHNPPHSYIVPPLKQIKSGINFHKVQCKEELELVYKKTDDTSACVMLATEIELVVRGWGEDNRLLLGCTPTRYEKCYPSDPLEYRKALYDYYFDETNLPSSGFFDFASLHTINACTDQSICFGEFDNGTKIRVSCDYPTHGCGVKSFDDYNVENEN